MTMLSPGKNPRNNQSGFSIFEILVALGIAAATIAVGAAYLGNKPVRQLREESARLIRIIRHAYFQASAQSQYYRLVFDLDDNKYHVEFSDTPFYIIREGDEKEELRKKNEEKARESESALDESADAPATVIEAKFSESEDDMLEVVQFAKHIDLKDIYVLHQKEKMEEDKAYLYFFPRGRSEFAVIHLADEDEENFMTLIVNPLNGAVEVRDGYVEHEEILEELGESS